MEKAAGHQQQLISELNALVKDIERCEKTIVELQTELERVNVEHKDRKTTRDDIAYLEDLLKCANKKLTWEKHMASLQKRTPAILEEMTKLINDPQAPPDDQTRSQMLLGLQAIQSAMERLQNVKVN
jgi:predicted RNase H-like nuclease (RuvC/YqgF family)